MRRLLDAQRQHGKPELPSYVDVIRVPPVASTLPAPENDDSVPGRPLPIDATHYYDTSTRYSAAVRSSDTSSSRDPYNDGTDDTDNIEKKNLKMADG